MRAFARRLGSGLAAFCLAFPAGCASRGLRVGPADGGEVVEAEGLSPYEEADLLGTKRRSLAEAQKKAVERVAGVYVSAKTRVAKAVTVDQNILANVGGYIKRYEIVSERREGAFYQTRIRALVRYEKLGADLKALGLTRPPPPLGDPRVLVLVVEKGAQPAASGGRASAAVRRGLADRGLRVVEPVEGAADSTPGGDSAAAAELGRRASADLVVRGEAESHRLEGVELGGFSSYRARVALEAIKSSTGELLAGRSQEASGMDATAEIAESKALEMAGRLCAENLGGEIADLLRRRVTVGLRLKGVSGLPAVERLAEELRLLPDIAMVTLSEYGKDRAELALSTDSLAGEALAALLLQMKRHRLVVRSVSPYMVEVEVGVEP